MLVTVLTAGGLGSGGVLFIGRRRRYIFVIYLLGLFSVISMFSNKNYFTVMICMLNKSCPDSLMVYTVKKKDTDDNNKGQLFSKVLVDR